MKGKVLRIRARSISGKSIYEYLYVSESSFPQGPFVNSPTQLWEPEYAIPLIESSHTLRKDNTEYKYQEEITIYKIIQPGDY